MAKRILFTCQPARTHVIPLERMIHLFMERGHDVVLATPAKMARTLRDYQIPHFPAGQDWTQNPRTQRLLGRALDQEGNAEFCRLLYGRFLPGIALSMASDVLALAKQWRPDLIVHDCSEFGGYLAGEVLGVPTISADNGLVRNIYERHTIIRPVLNGARGRLGLGAEPRRAPGSLRRLLTPAPREFLLGDLHIPGLVDYRHENPQKPGERLPRWVHQRPPNVPFVYVMLGSTGWEVPGLGEVIERANRVVIEALNQSECHALVSVGPPNVGKYNPAPNVKVVGYAAQPLALAEADVFIAHGGFAGLREAIAGGTPMVVLPHCNDQPTNAWRVAETGLGVAISDSRLADPTWVLEALDHVLRNRPRYADAVARMQRATGRLPSLETIVTELERSI